MRWAVRGALFISWARASARTWPGGSLRSTRIEYRHWSASTFPIPGRWPQAGRSPKRRRRDRRRNSTTSRKLPGRATSGTCSKRCSRSRVCRPINGQPMRSCALPTSAAEGAKVTTIEGLTEDGNHPVQVAWRELNVAQCGYCQPGQIMSAVGLLERIPNPTDADIDQAMSGNICRCGTYTRIRKAIHRAAEDKS